MSSSPTYHLAARVPPELREQLEAVARANERSASAELRIAVRRHVLFETRPARAGEITSERTTR